MSSKILDNVHEFIVPSLSKSLWNKFTTYTNFLAAKSIGDIIALINLSFFKWCFAYGSKPTYGQEHKSIIGVYYVNRIWYKMDIERSLKLNAPYPVEMPSSEGSGWDCAKMYSRLKNLKINDACRYDKSKIVAGTICEEFYQ